MDTDTRTANDKDTLYFDGTCPLCRFEIDHLKKLADDGLELVDVHTTSGDASLPSRAAMLKRLHLRSADGTYITGLDATVFAWQHTRLGFLLKVLRWPIIRVVVDYCYNRWAAARFSKRYPQIAS